MKIKYVFICVLIALKTYGQQNSQKIERKEDGTVWVLSNGIKVAEGKVQNDKRDGKWMFYDTEGRLKAEITYKMGLLNGMSAYYNPETNIKYAEGWNENDKRKGEWRFYNQSDGKLKAIEEYDGMILNGSTKYFDSTTGKVYLEMPYKNGKIDGVTKYYNPETGYLVSEMMLRDRAEDGEIRYYFNDHRKMLKLSTYSKNDIGNGRTVYYDSVSGKPMLEMDIKNGLWDGENKQYDSKGRLMTFSHYKEGKQNGYMLCMDSLTGNKKHEGFWNMDKRDGVWTFYNSTNGKLFATETYRDGLLNGKNIIYDSISGKPISESNFKNGLLDGESKQYYSNGSLLMHSHYKEGNLHGQVLYIDSVTGNKIHEGFWKMGKRDGFWKFYNGQNGKLIITESYRGGLLHGDLIVYDSLTGKKVKEGTYHNNTRTGKWVYYNGLTGDVVAEENINNNGEESELIWYDEHYKKAVVINYRNGMKNGKCYYYYPHSDIPRFEYYCKNDSADGEFIVRYLSGKIKRREVYKSGVFISGKCYDESGNEIDFTPIRVRAGYRDDIMTYLGDNIQYPENAKRLGIEGKVIVRFVVNKNGRISDVEVVKNLSKECDDEAIRVISQMPPWEPARIDDEALETYETLPIVFWIH